MNAEEKSSEETPSPPRGPVPGRRYTYADYLTWDDGQRWELIDGVPYCMTPAPNTAHQRIVVNIVQQFAGALDGHPCQLFVAPLDVRLSTQPGAFGHQAESAEAGGSDAGDHVVQPDVLVVCDEAKIGERGVTGAPDLVLEVLSPSSYSRDHIQKRDLYERAGVKEYWIADPQHKALQIYRLDKEGRYGKADLAEAHQTLTSTAIDGLALDLGLVFGAPPTSKPASDAPPKEPAP